MSRGSRDKALFFDLGKSSEDVVNRARKVLETPPFDPLQPERTAPSVSLGGLPPGASSQVRADDNRAFYGLTNVPDDVLAKHISAPGQLKLPPEILPPLLESRRIEHYLPDQAFDIMPAVDTVHVWQVGRPRSTFTEGGSIIMSENSRDAARFESPRGMIVSAGLLAMDQLRSHGMDLGHMVYLLRMSPYRMPLDLVHSKETGGLLVLHAGDIKGSEDTMAMLRSGELRIERVKETVEGVETERHVYKRRDGSELVPIRPWMPEET